MAEFEEPDFEPGQIVESTSGFFRGRGEVVRKVSTRHGWFVQVLHESQGNTVHSLCDPQKLRRVDTRSQG